MKELIACLLFLVCGIYSQTKLKIIETVLFVLLLYLTNFIFLLNRKFEQDIKTKFENYKSLMINIVDQINYKKIILYFVFFLYGYISSYYTNNHYNLKADECLYVNDQYEGIITDVIERENNYKVKIKIKSINENVEIYIDKTITNDLLPGYKIKMKGILANINETKNLGSYNEKEYKKQHRIFYNFQGDVVSIEKGYTFLKTDLYKLRKIICSTYDSLLDEKYSSIVKAMITGENSLIDDDTKKLYKNAGVFHILAISGMHIGIIVACLKKLLKKLPLCKTNKYFVLVSILISYVLFTGASISTIRAMLMTCFSELGTLFNREYDSKEGLCLAAIIILMINSANLFNISFILSFSAIVSMNLKLDFKGIFKNYSSTISVFLLMTPVLIYNFYSFQGLSIIANIFILPLTGTLVISSFVILFLNVINVNLAIILGKIISLILIYYEEVLKYLSNLAGFNVISGKLSLITIILWYMTYLCLYKLFKTKKNTIYEKRRCIQLIVLLLLFLLAFIFSIFHKQKEIEITFFDVEHGDAALIYDKEKQKSMIIDGGGKNDNLKDQGTYKIKPYLDYLGITKVDLCVVTHTDRDHIKGIVELIDLIDIGSICMANANHEGTYYEELINKCKANNVPIIYLTEGDMFQIGDATCTVLYPPGQIDTYNFTENNKSLVIDVKIENLDFLFTGDIEKEAEQILCANLPYNVFLLKVPHHGSNTSSTDDFAKIVSPKYLILSGNKTNVNNFNKSNVYKYNNSTVITTYYSGMINFKIKKGEENAK